jgi:predicted ArsR family transcriptional regulator
MSSSTTEPCIDQIGETAGLVWQLLNTTGPLSLAKLAKQVNAPRDTVMQAVGWLAREGKVWVENGTRGRTVSLR